MQQHILSNLYYIVIPTMVIAVSQMGRVFTASGMNWYDTSLKLPWFTPAKWIFPIAWTGIFIAATISAIVVWKELRQDKKFLLINTLFMINAVLNVMWSYLFFYQHLIGMAVVDAALLTVTVYGLIGLLWNKNRCAALLLIPYALWTTFATYLNFVIWQIN